MPCSHPLLEYLGRITELQARVERLRSRYFQLCAIAATTLILAIALLVFGGKRMASSNKLAASAAFVCAVFASREILRNRQESMRHGRRLTFYERGVERLNGTWQGRGANGEQYARSAHLYQEDLSILGEGSIFELLSTTRSEVGAERLADFLLSPVSAGERRDRQEAVRELSRLQSFREELSLLGKYEFQRCNRAVLEEWLDQPPVRAQWWFRAFLLASSACSLLLGVLGIASIMSWGQVAIIIWPFLLLNATAGILFFRRTRPLLKSFRQFTNEFTVLSQGLALLERHQFNSAQLSRISVRLVDQQAAAHVSKMDLLMRACDRREKEVLYVPSLLLGAGTQLVFAIEQWRFVYGHPFRQWLDLWAEVDALCALATYAYEHESHVFPEFSEDTLEFTATQLAHPLLPPETRVGNDISFDAAQRLYLISGSNMAGKSTLLRSIGIAVVLANAGAPVCAARLRISSLRLGASIAVADSLAEGKSKFLAEAEKLRGILECSRQGEPVLFLIDEILSGTNSRDRKAAAEAIVRALIKSGASGVLSTHDLALTEIASERPLCAVNMHMESANAADPLDFDYKLKPGIAHNSSAAAILERIGLQQLAENSVLQSSQD